jgi:RNA polymerase sigma-70 factor (ECF subfamily)
MSSASIEDNETLRLVELCQLRDEASVRLFIQRYQQLIFAVSFRMLGQREDAEDVTQESLLRALNNLHQWDKQRSIKPWLVTIAVNRCRTRLSQRKVQLHQLEFENQIPEHHTHENNDLQEELRLAIESLKPEYRLCFSLFYQQQCSCQEISEIMECPVGTIKTWLFRARQILMDHLSRRHVLPEMKS